MIPSKESVLEQYWGFTEFRPQQSEIIEAVLEGKDVLALLPTGAGKSICYQVPALSLPGICIVVSPLVALIEDQVNALKKRGIKAIGLTAGIPPSEIDTLLDNCIYGQYKFLYLSPERLQQPLVKDRIAKMKVNLIAIDEAHCISQWGHDFRPAYLSCDLLKELCEAPLIAVTATATQKVVEEIQQNLKMTSARLFKASYYRPNIQYSVKKTKNKRLALLEYCKETHGSIIVYVNSRGLAENLCEFLNAQNFSATYYHGGLKKELKSKALHKWLHNDASIMVATNAFGMGIDKDNVSAIFHYQLSESLEQYYQESGRAGRNGEAAKAVILFEESDIERINNIHISQYPDVSTVGMVYQKLNSFLRIAYGEKPEGSFSINFNQFCHQYGLSAIKTYNAIKVLDQNQVLSVQTRGNVTTQIKFTASKNDFEQCMRTTPSYAPLLDTLLRTYGGLFEIETSINLYVLSKKLKESESKIVADLKKLAELEFISLKEQSSDMEIYYLVPREDQYTIASFSKALEKQLETKKVKVRASIDYVTNTTECRNQIILRYFGETFTSCGNCDHCLKKDKKEDLSVISVEILKLIEQQACDSRGIISQLSFSENSILAALKELLDQQRIEIKSNNEYHITLKKP